MTSKLSADVAIIGGGIVGLACAYELVTRGKRVVVLERETTGSGAGRVAAGMLAPVSEAEAGNDGLVDLALASCAMYEDWIAAVEAASGLECGYRKEGSLLLALHRDHEEELHQLQGVHRRLNLESEILSRGEVLKREPYVSPRVVSGLLLPDDRQVDPRRLTRALAAALAAGGATVLEGRTATPVVEGGHVTGARADDVEVEAEALLVAGGVWSADVWPQAAGPLPLRPVKGQIFRLRGAELIRHVVRTPDVYLVPRRDGELVVGATSEEQGFDTSVTTWAVMDLLREAWRVVPGIAELEVAELSAGLRPALRDHVPAIGASALEGLFVATGHYRHGVMLAPLTAKLAADAIDGAGSDTLRALSPARFTEAKVAGK